MLVIRLLDACRRVTRKLRTRIKQKELSKGMLVRLKHETWSDFVDTNTVGMVTSWNGKEVRVVFTSGKRENHWIWNLVRFNEKR